MNPAFTAAFVRFVETKRVPVYTKDGQIIGYVSQRATSVGASKLVGGRVEYSNRFGQYGWVCK
jgi:hypothetical protein